MVVFYEGKAPRFRRCEAEHTVSFIDPFRQVVQIDLAGNPYLGTSRARRA